MSTAMPVGRIDASVNLMRVAYHFLLVDCLAEGVLRGRLRCWRSQIGVHLLHVMIVDTLKVSLMVSSGFLRNYDLRWWSTLVRLAQSDDLFAHSSGMRFGSGPSSTTCTIESTADGSTSSNAMSGRRSSVRSARGPFVAAEQSADAGTGLLTVGRAGRSRQTTVCAVARQQTAQTGLRMVAAKVDAKLPIAEGEKLRYWAGQSALYDHEDQQSDRAGGRLHGLVKMF